MTKSKKALILINTGTPTKPTTSAVRGYLFSFLNDKRIIDIPWLARKILVNMIIVPFRAPKSAKLYQKLWTKDGSPLLIHMNNLTEKVQKKLKATYDVYGSMRYGQPSFQKILRSLLNKKYEEITILPLYPHYATSTTESVADIVKQEVNNKTPNPYIHFIRQFYSNKSFIKAFSERITQYDPQSYDHIVFSYHGLPLRQINKLHPEINSKTCPCKDEVPKHGKYCYKATCYHTTRLLANKLNLNKNHITTAFQSRLSKNWLRPFTDETLINLAQNKKKKVLIIAPSFVADCLETNIELGQEYTKLFKKNGGHEITLVKSLNDMDKWVDAIIDIIEI